MMCPSCGYTVDSGTTICPRCGRSLTTWMLPAEGSVADAPTMATVHRQEPMETVAPQPQPQPRSRHKTRLWLGLALVAMLVIVGTGGAFVLAQGRTPAGQRNAASAGATATTLPTATPLPAATATPRPTATPTPQPQLVTVFQDPLTSNRNGWYDGSNCTFQSDGYHIRNGYECFAPIGSQSSVNISVQVKQIHGTDVDYGIGFRSNGPQTEYYMYIADNGVWSVIKTINGRLSTLVSKTASGAIHQGLDQVNTLEVDCSGSTFAFFINGVRVGSATDSSLPSGKIGLQVDPNSIGTGLEVVYTNFKVTKWV